MKRPLLLYALLLTLYTLVLSACQTVETFLPTPTPTATATPTQTPTPTIIWFPPTNTPTPFPTVEIPPTPDQRAGIGELLYSDDFSTGEGWPLLTSARGNVALSPNRLTLTVFEPRALVSSVLQGVVFGDFYLEITAQTSLCSGEDQYGVLFRAASQADFYRFALSCDGQTRLDRLVGGVASSPQTWMFTSAVPVGPAGTVRLAVWAVGREMRFFINDQFQFSINDPMISSGGIGVFARAAGETAMTVNFSELEVYAVSP
ncbi:MAG: hypothetical protein HUU38_02955 [Anaerolineales bacterium]|nr:hypothetical protein [Anaerolineales bacterium]